MVESRDGPIPAHFDYLKGSRTRKPEIVRGKQGWDDSWDSNRNSREEKGIAKIHHCTIIFAKIVS